MVKEKLNRQEDSFSRAKVWRNWKQRINASAIL